MILRNSYFIIMMLFSIFKIHSQDMPIISYQVGPGIGCSVFVPWTADPKPDSLIFEVQKSVNNITWSKMEVINPKKNHTYQYCDNNPVDGYNYYRVIQIGGKSINTTETKWIHLNRNAEIFIWPNPLLDVVYVRTTFLSGSISVIDMEVNNILQKTITDFVTTIPTARLKEGIYLVEITHEKDLFIENFRKDW